MALRAPLLCLFLTALGACTTTADTSTDEAEPVDSPLAIDLSLQLSALNACSGGSGGAVRAQAVAPRGGNLLLIQASELLARKGTPSQSDVVLRSPGACGSLSPCGHFLVRIDQSTPFVVSTRTFEVPLEGLAQPFGAHTLEVQFRGDNELQAVGSDGAPVTRSLALDVIAPDDTTCAPPG